MISVVMPARDRWPLTSVSLKSALAPQGCDLEVIVVDDGSTTVHPADFAQRDERVTMLHLPRPHGPAAARNRGLEAVHDAHRARGWPSERHATPIGR
jgi:glycosyltransferase involved in cell wall biosynthesis